MAKFIFLLFLLLVFTTLDQVSASPGCISENGCVYPKLAEYNRKMLMSLKRISSTTIENGKSKFNDAELRSVPGGPDPLHHNGGTQKRPRSSP